MKKLKIITPETFVAYPPETHPERLYVLEVLKTFKQINDKPRILDIGCGGNKTTIEATGIDIRPVTDVVAEADQLPIKSNSVDVIISRHSFEHFLDPVAVLYEWTRVIKSGGIFVFVLPDHGYIDTMNPVLSSNVHLHAYSRESFARLIGLFPMLRLNRLDTVCKEWSFGAIVSVVTVKR